MLIHNAVVTNADPHAARQQQSALMGAAVRRSSTLIAAEDHLEMLDLSRSISPSDDLTQAYVRITRGCNKFCTYCVVPYTRGPEVHRPPRNIIDEVKKLVDAGAKEVTLLGQTVNHYAYAHGNGRVTTFAQLLYLIHEATPGLPRLRFVTSFPRDFTDEALQAMRDCPRICRYLHVPAQSGSDRILKLMNRGYTSGQYRDFIARAKSIMPDISLASDFIVGFPTETPEDFEASVDLLRECRFKNSFIFKYSPRPGTTAIERFADDVSEEEKRRRNNALLAVQQEVSAANSRAMIGKIVEVMVEGQSKLVSRRQAVIGKVELAWERRRAAAAVAVAMADEPARTQMVGRTRGDQVVVFDGHHSQKGEILDVEIVDAQSLTLFGRIAAASMPLSPACTCGASA
jgi:tRNA-2-methylthio-N6-dimethylallyladenosine synthase